MNVTIIDDEPKIRRGLANLVKLYRPQWPEAAIAGNAEAALEDPGFWQTDILFLDIQLPGMDGLTLLKHIRQKTERMQVAIISGHAEFTFAQKAMSLGVSQYLLKPIDVGDVRAVLERAEEKLRAAPVPRPPEPDSPGGEALTDQTLYVEALLNRQSSLHPSVEAALKFIEENYPGDLSLRRISAQVHLHSSYLSELFKKETGYSLCNFIADYRLTQAKRVLRRSGSKVSAVAEAVGFSDYHYFSQVFSRRVGVSPRKYRAQGGAPQSRQEEKQIN